MYKMYKNKMIVLGTVLIIAAIGAYLIIGSHAAGPYASVEADNATLSSSASLQNDPNSSAGSYVKLGTNSTSPTSTISPTPDTNGLATPSGGWHVDLADDFNAPLGTGSGQDNIWYPSWGNNSTPTNTVYGANSYETECYNSSQVSVSNGNLALTAKYQYDALPASANFVQCNYLSGRTPKHIAHLYLL